MAKSIAELLEQVKLILLSTTDEETAKILAATGYDEAAIKNGQTLYDSAADRLTSVETATRNQLIATRTVKEMTQSVKDNYQRLSQTAGTVFKKDETVIKTLSLSITQRSNNKKTVPQVIDTDANAEPMPANPAKKSSRDRSQATFLNQARKLYEGVLKDANILAQLSKFGYAEERLKTERGEITALEEANFAQEKAKSAARIEKAAQKATLSELNQWVSQFTGIVTPALKAKPELLRVMGLKTRKG